MYSQLICDIINIPLCPAKMMVLSIISTMSIGSCEGKIGFLNLNI